MDSEDRAAGFSIGGVVCIVRLLACLLPPSGTTQAKHIGCVFLFTALNSAASGHCNRTEAFIVMRISMTIPSKTQERKQRAEMRKFSTYHPQSSKACVMTTYTRAASSYDSAVGEYIAFVPPGYLRPSIFRKGSPHLASFAAVSSVRRRAAS
jgi:hypothetical protein